MTGSLGRMSWAASRRTWWIGWDGRVLRSVLMLRAPWNSPLFSERYGHAIPVLRFLGWRVFVRHTMRFDLTP